MSYQAKRRHAAGQYVRAGEEEHCCEDILGQEFVELLGQVMTQNRHVSEDDGWVDQEAFVVNIHGTRLKITAARFEGEYLAVVNSNTMPVSLTQWVRRTYALDLRRVEGRIEVLRWLLGLVQYLYSGQAEIALLKKVLRWGHATTAARYTVSKTKRRRGRVEFAAASLGSPGVSSFAVAYRSG